MSVSLLCAPLAQALQVCVLFSVFVHFVWLLGLLKQHRRLASLAANATAFGLVVQIVIIIVQVVRGTTSHFNFSTPQDEALWRFMEIALICFGQQLWLR